MEVEYPITSINDVQKLLANGTINTPVRGNTPLHHAVGNENCPIEVIEYMLQNGANVEALNEKYLTPLESLVRLSHKNAINIACLLLDHGAQLKMRSGLGPPVLHWAVDSGCNKDIVKFLLDRGANLHESSDFQKTALHVALLKGRDYDIIKFLLDQGANVHMRRFFGRLPLHDAAYSGNPRIVKLLVNYGAEVNVKDNGNFSPLYRSAAFNKEDATKCLLKCGALVCCGEPPLPKAISMYYKQDDEEKYGRFDELTGRMTLEHLKLLLLYALLENAALNTDNCTFSLPVELKDYKEDCLGEIDAMQHVSVGKDTLLQFIFHLRQQPRRIGKDDVNWVLNTLLRHIHSNAFPIYNDVMISVIKKKYLENFLGNQVLYAKSNTKDHCFKSRQHEQLLSVDEAPKASMQLDPLLSCQNPIMLPNDILRILTRYLSKVDMLNFALAYYLPKCSCDLCCLEFKSKQHKRFFSTDKVPNLSKKKAKIEIITID